jgi:hypothetical protein
LERALAALWPDVPAQRCTVHKHRNLLAHAPDALHEEVSADYTDMIYAATSAPGRLGEAGQGSTGDAAGMPAEGGLCPANHESAGKQTRRGTRKGNPYLKATEVVPVLQTGG